jgi:hypothetical protein
MQTSTDSIPPLPDRSLTLGEIRYIRQLLDVIEKAMLLPQNSHEYRHAALRATADLVGSLVEHGHAAPISLKSLADQSPVYLLIAWSEDKSRWYIRTAHRKLTFVNQAMHQARKLEPSVSFSIQGLEQWENLDKKHHPAPGLGSPDTGGVAFGESLMGSIGQPVSLSPSPSYQNNLATLVSPGPLSDPQPIYYQGSDTPQWVEDLGGDHESDE